MSIEPVIGGLVEDLPDQYPGQLRVVIKFTHRRGQIMKSQGLEQWNGIAWELVPVEEDLESKKEAMKDLKVHNTLVKPKSPKIIMR